MGRLVAAISLFASIVALAGCVQGPSQPQEGPPPTIRLRKFLKMALRAYGLRCTKVVGVVDGKVETLVAPTEEATPIEGKPCQ